jgi:hypothetical protein
MIQKQCITQKGINEASSFKVILEPTKLGKGEARQVAKFPSIKNRPDKNIPGRRLCSGLLSREKAGRPRA